MALVTTKEMFQRAYHGGYAIGAFNFNNMETIQAITEACREERSPVILQVSQDVRANHTYMVKLAEAAVMECPGIRSPPPQPASPYRCGWRGHPGRPV